MLLLMFGGAQVQRLFELLPFGTSIADSREKKKEKCQEIGLTNLGKVYILNINYKKQGQTC